MFTIRQICKAQSIEEALALVKKSPKNTILSGCHFLKMGHKKIHTAIDMTGLGLDYIKEEDGVFSIGAMCTYAQIEDHEDLRHFADGILPFAVSRIVSRQLRNTACVGGSVFMKYAFSDFITPLLALDASVVLAERGQMSLEEFLLSPHFRDILIEVRIPIVKQRAVYVDERKIEQDFPLLNVAVSNGDQLRIVCGSRPQRAIRMRQTESAFLKKDGNLAEIAVKEAALGDNLQAGAATRAYLLRGLLDEALWAVTK